MNPETPEAPAVHEYDGIIEHDNPLPAWWLWTFAGTVLFAIGYWFMKQQWPALSSFEIYGDEQAEYDRIALSVDIDPVALRALAKDPTAVAAGHALYDLKCVPCHGTKGEGTVGPNLTDKFWLHGGDPKSLYMTIAGGYPKLGMPQWRAVLEDQQVKELVAYIQTLRDTNAPGKPPQGTEYVGDSQ